MLFEGRHLSKVVFLTNYIRKIDQGLHKYNSWTTQTYSFWTGFPKGNLITHPLRRLHMGHEQKLMFY